MMVFPNIVTIQKAKTSFILENLRPIYLSIRERLILVSMLMAISVFLFESLPSCRANITITHRVLIQRRRKWHY